MEMPDEEALKEILSQEGAPPHIVLDIGGSEDLDGDGLVKVSLSDSGELIYEDA